MLAARTLRLSGAASLSASESIASGPPSASHEQSGNCLGSGLG